MVGAGVEGALEPAERLDDAALRQRPHRRDRVRPDVADLEHERRPMGAAHRHARPPRKELWRGGDDDVRTRPEPGSRQSGRDHVREEVEAAAHASPVGRQVGPHPHRADAVDPLDLATTVLVALEGHAGGNVGHAGEHRDAVSESRPLARQCMHARRRRVVLGDEVMGQEEDVHPRRPAHSSQKTWS